MWFLSGRGDVGGSFPRTKRDRCVAYFVRKRRLTGVPAGGGSELAGDEGVDEAGEAVDDLRVERRRGAQHRARIGRVLACRLDRAGHGVAGRDEVPCARQRVAVDLSAEKITQLGRLVE